MQKSREISESIRGAKRRGLSITTKTIRHIDFFQSNLLKKVIYVVSKSLIR